MNNDERILNKLDQIDSKVDDHARSLAGLTVKVDYLATREDVSTAIATHIADKHKSAPPPAPTNWKPIVKGVGLVLGALAALLGAIAATYAAQ